MPRLNELTRFQALKRIIDVQLALWPDHEKFLQSSFNGRDERQLMASQAIAELIMRLAGENLQDFCRDYRWLCDRMVEEEVHFRRTGKYRLSSSIEAEGAVYDNQDFMPRYLNGILLSQLFWANHAGAMSSYLHDFLPKNQDRYDHLEVGPGHGLFFYFAAQDPRCKSVTGWDVSPSSIAATTQCLKLLGVTREVALLLQDVFKAAPSDRRFHSVVISEVLEHTDNPRAALENLFRHLTPGGRLFVNMPVNSPAPDHIYLLHSPEEVADLVKRSGFEIEHMVLFPATGYSEAQARRHKLTISVVVIACRPA